MKDNQFIKIAFANIILWGCIFMLPIKLNAETTPLIFVDSQTVAQNSSTICCLLIQDVENYSALQITVYYDSKAFSILGAYFGLVHEYFSVHEKAYSLETPGEISSGVIIRENTSTTGSLLHFILPQKQIPHWEHALCLLQ